MSGLLVNPVFVSKFYKQYGGADGTTSAVNPSIIGISVSCLQASAAIGALVAGRLGDIIGRKKCVRIGAFIYFFTAFMQMFAPGFKTVRATKSCHILAQSHMNTSISLVANACSDMI